MEYRCPKCNRLLYSRRHQACGFCGAVLPAELLFSEEEIKGVNAELAKIEEERLKEQLQKEAEEKQRQKKKGWRRFFYR